ncbi:dynein axonemal assembly factor 3 [Venturia canescens]|uniref:dynein axonemal assembly factor 3 n=1 Tax=Venturia canescens TaxID=32260 RepID=UPI001C9C281F|nr:dynein axonemal assembly factor 3 [Venturia canescens]
MWWGNSPPLDLRREINENVSGNCQSPLEFLIIGSGDARHIVKTLASAYNYEKRRINFHVIEPTLEQIARSILLLNICLEKNLGLQESTRYYLEVYGNTLLRPATAKYLAKRIYRLADIPTQTLNCPWLELDKLRHRDRDTIEGIFKFWSRAICDGVPITEYWDRRVRKNLGVRYDYRDGAFDWDFNMVLKSRDVPNLTLQEYKFWRNNGIAFTWFEGEPARSNPTLLSNVMSHGAGFVHYAYTEDITNGPFFTWALDEENKKKKFRATDVAERGVMRAIHEIRTNEPLCEDAIAAHRDSSILNGTLVTEMPDMEIEHESWILGNNIRLNKENIDWVDRLESKVIFHPVSSLNTYKNKSDYVEKFDVIWMGNNVTKHLENVSALAKKGGHVLVESRKFLVDLRLEGQKKFTEELKKLAYDNGLRELDEFHSEKHTVARFRRE